MLALFLILTGAVVVFAITGFRAWDDLIRYQYEKHYDAWVADGRPKGFFYVPPGSNPWTHFRVSSFPREKSPVPTWAVGDPGAELRFVRLVQLARWQRRAFPIFIPLWIVLAIAATR